MIRYIRSFAKQAIPFALPVYAAIGRHLSRLKVRRKVKDLHDICVELGAGKRRGKGSWITIDMNSACDICWDLRNGIPFPDESLKKIYSSHFFEHLSFREAQQFLDECKRVLVPGGQFSICVPNARIYIEAYVNDNSFDASKFLVYEPACNHTTRIDFVNYMAYMGSEHKYMFDEENLIYILASKGFKNPRLRQFDPALDLAERDYESIYAEAEK